MSWIDLLRMSASNLKRRKLRTFLTVLGVVIGTASIVVMVSLGLGLQKSVYDEMEQSGGLTTMSVTGGESVGDGMMYDSSGSGDSNDKSKYIDDSCVKKFGELEHVKAAVPVYETSGILLKGKYEGYCSLYASTPEGLKMRDIKLAEGGSLPKSGTGKLDLVYGNNVITNFSERGNNSSGYWETGELPDIDLMKDSMFLILDQDAYYNSQNSGGFQTDTTSGSDGQSTSNTPASAKKHIVTASGVVAGGVDDYNSNSYYVFCDLETLKQIMKKEFSGRVIPGQPSTKSGKPYKEFYYSSAQVKVDDMSNVNAVATQIREMGYNVQTNAEYMESMKKQMAIIQAVLGGIGAISLIVAAIGIANTMMMSIYERTKEIGVIKVLGCSLKNIKQMFLIEAAFIGLLGGLVGNIISFAMSGVINMVTAQSSALGVEGNISYIPLWLVLISLGFAMLVGMVAGYFPALRAMRLSPLAAIRSE